MNGQEIDIEKKMTTFVDGNKVYRVVKTKVNFEHLGIVHTHMN